jgi:hypothetical protein
MIEVQYFEECPNAASTIENVMSLVSKSVIDEREVKLTLVNNPELAEEASFQGSPTILVDGVDIYTEKKPIGYSFNCRIYQIDGGSTGILPKLFIKEQLTKIRTSSNNSC